MSEATQKPVTGSPGAGSPVTGSLAWPFTPPEGLTEAWQRIEVEEGAKSGTLDIGGLQLNEEMLGELAPAIARLDWLEALYLGAGEDARKKPWFERTDIDKKLYNAARALPGALVDAASPRLTLLDLDGLGLEHLPERIAALTGLGANTPSATTGRGRWPPSPASPASTSGPTPSAIWDLSVRCRLWKRCKSAIETRYLHQKLMVMCGVSASGKSWCCTRSGCPASRWKCFRPVNIVHATKRCAIIFLI